MTDLIWSFAPWAAFLVAVRLGNVYWAACLAAVAAILVVVRAVSRHEAQLFDYVSAVYFVGMLALLAIIQPADISLWGRYAQAVAHGSLTLIVFLSVLVGRPFTEAYARQRTPREVWDTPHFRTFNRKISLFWGLAFLVGTISLTVAGSTNAHQVLLRIIIPFGALAYTYTYTQRQASLAKSRQSARPAHPWTSPDSEEWSSARGADSQGRFRGSHGNR
jgi:hypothetical protein